MKKYHQLLLVSLSAISLSLFLVYRHEYNRLHYVLEVFNFFGQPCNFSELQQADFMIEQHDWGPQPLWQEVDNGYVYSAFLTGNNDVKAIALPNNAESVPRTCFLWFEDKRKPTPGKFKFAKMGIDEHGGYYYFCSAMSTESAPFAVSFGYKPGRESDLKKILVTGTSNNELRKNVMVCVSPSVFSKKKFIEFISFHKVIGINSFIFYESDIPHRLSKLIRNLSQRIDVQVAFLPWNFPKRDVSSARAIVESDCLLRTFRQSKYVITLEMNEYLLPKQSLQSFLNKVPSGSLKVTLPVKRFCVNSLTPDKPIALQNYEAISDFKYNTVRNMFGNDNDSFVDLGIVQGQAWIHKYIRCNSAHSKTTMDYSMDKFSTDLTRSTLVQLLLHGQL